MGAKVSNPRKQFQFNIIIPGLNPFLAQEVKTPDEELDQVEHGDTGYLVKTAGMRKISNLTITQIQPADGTDTYINNWFDSIMNTTRGGGVPPSQYKKHIIVEEYANDGQTVIERTIYKGCWPQKKNGKEYSRRGSDNTTRSLEFSVDE